MDELIHQIHQEIKAAEAVNANLKSDGTLVTSVLRSIARRNFQLVNNFPKDSVFSVCEQLLESGDGRDKAIAFQWAFRIRRQYQPIDYQRFEEWLARYVDSWGSCDDFCTHAFGHLVFAFPEQISSVKSWTTSENRWFRRGAAVVLIYGIRRGKNFESAFDVADRLLMDSDHMVQKGYGWMLKEVSNLEPRRVFDFVMERKSWMSRTSLRYAIEKLEPRLREQAMSK